jgi:hypothetical protein
MKDINPTGENLWLPGFTQINLDKHFGSGLTSDHSDQYPNFTKEQYAMKALTLARSAVNNGVEGYMATHGLFKGSIVRYDTSTNDWVRATPRGITTMFKPKDSYAYYKLINKIEARGE